MRRFLAIGVAAVCVATPAMADVAWVRAKGSCVEACGRAGMRPVATGLHAQGRPYLLCATNAMGEGMRPGYNLEPDWSNACWVGYGGKEIPSTPFQCLCQDHRIVPLAE